MGFRENLKNELSYNSILVKELAATSGVHRYTIDKYLTEYGSNPSAENAVKIAQVLGVTVEYLVTGRQGAGITPIVREKSPKTGLIIRACQELDDNGRDIITAFAKTLKTWHGKKQT
jgi:transcriptional regulator with XRE-family HTH domain